MRNLKKIALLVLAISVLVFSFTSCDVVQDLASKIPGIDAIPGIGAILGNGDHVHAFGDATCTTPATCECGETEGEALGHNFADGKCTVCEEEDPNYVPPHTHSYEAVVTAPTCTEAGYTTYTCACGDSYKADETAATGHNYVDGKCACGAEDQGYVPPHEHSYEPTVTAPTCTEAGYTTYTCACGHSYTTEGEAALGHNYESTVTAPTCTEAGYTTYTCACGHSYTTEGEAALGHIFINSICTVCNAEYVPAPTTLEWTLVTELKDGDLVLIGAPAYGKLLSAEKVNATSYYNKGVDYSEDNFANVTDAEIFLVTVNEDGTYTFTSLTGDVIALASSYSSLNKDGEHKSWKLESRNDGTFLVKNVGRNTYLEWYSSKNNWSTYTAGNTAEYYLSFYAKTEVESGAHVHNHISSAVAPTCTETGYTAYVCACGDSYKVDGEAALGHTYESVATAPTCTEAGYTTYTCACGDSYKVDGEAALGHTYVDGKCACGAEDPDYHTHSYDIITTTATCTEAGLTIYTCSCGDSYSEEAEKLGHVDADLDVSCDREGCTTKVAPAAESVLSTFTANNLGSKLSTDNQYYVEGTIVEVLDAKNGIFLIDDGSGETFYFRLPKNADGVSHASWDIKLVLGDKVRIHGKINKYSTSSAPNGQFYPAMQGPTVEYIEQHTHDYTAIPATCSDPAFCACGLSYGEPLDCTDTNSDDLCDACGKNVKYAYEYVEIRTDNNSGVIDTTAGTYTWGNDNFDVQVLKGTSSQLYSTSKDHMRVYKGNQFVLVNKTGIVVSTITVHLTNATQVGNFEKFLTGYTYTKDEENFTVTVEINSAETIIFTNTASTTQIKGVEFGYENADAHTHTFKEETTSPTCTEAGYTTYTCSECGESYTEDISPLGHSDENGDYKCDSCGEVMLPADGEALTIAQALALAKAMGNTYTANKYYVTGRIVDIANTFYGNFNIVDADGNKLYVYGLKNATGEGNFSNLDPQPAVGDEITIYTVLGCYSDAPQAKDAWLDELVQHTEHTYTEATCTEAKTCTICGKTDGEPIEHTYVDGACTGCGKSEPAEGVIITSTEPFAGLTKSGSYKNVTTTSGWTATNAAVLVGGASDANPVFTFIGADESTVAITLNGKVGASGKLTSATLSNGISKLSFNYGNAFSEKNGVDVTINILQNGEVVATTRLDNDSVTQKTAYDFSWELDTVVEGEFVIEIVNNNPTGSSSSNKDRISIFNFTWDSAPIAEA